MKTYGCSEEQRWIVGWYWVPEGHRAQFYPPRDVCSALIPREGDLSHGISHRENISRESSLLRFLTAGGTIRRSITGLAIANLCNIYEKQSICVIKHAKFRIFHIVALLL